MKVIASYLTKKEAQNFSRAFPNSRISLMDSKQAHKDEMNTVADKPYWCVYD